jgi:hypothetical protein
MLSQGKPVHTVPRSHSKAVQQDANAKAERRRFEALAWGASGANQRASTPAIVGKSAKKAVKINMAVAASGEATPP